MNEEAASVQLREKDKSNLKERGVEGSKTHSTKKGGPICTTGNKY